MPAIFAFQLDELVLIVFFKFTALTCDALLLLSYIIVKAATRLDCILAHC